jgi:drug/metabolite transporter (DMT)-like permease
MLRKYSSPVFAATTLGMGSAVFILISIPYLLRQDWAGVSTRANLELLYSAVFALVISYLLFFYAVGILGSTRTSIYTNLIPFSGLLFAWLFLGESIGLLQLAGACLIIAGIRIAR